MTWPSLMTYDRVEPDNGRDERESGYEKSYFGMRLIIGFIGVALPLALVLVDWWWLRGPVSVRGSMSVYYHSSARDLFVGGLSACGVTLITYMFWKWWTWDFLISLLGGLGVLGVATFPTARPRVGEMPDKTCSYSHKGVPPITALQQALGEGTTRTIHLSVTVAAVTAFAALCLVFALREFGYGRAAHALVGDDMDELGPRKIWNRLRTVSSPPPPPLPPPPPTPPPPPGPKLSRIGVLVYTWRHSSRTVLYLLCFLGVLVGAAWATPVGADIVLPHTYAGEFVAFTSFGSAWIVASWDLLKRAGLVDATVRGIGGTLGVQFPPP
jgi:hypothetical protein